LDIDIATLNAGTTKLTKGKQLHTTLMSTLSA